MQYDQFIGQVQQRGHLPSLGDAVAATRATLETLAERITVGAANNLASQLPREIGEYLRHPVTPNVYAGERFTLDEFFKRVNEREGGDLPDSVYHARVVVDVLQEAVSGGEIENLQAQLPAEFTALFAAGSEGRMPKKNKGSAKK